MKKAEANLQIVGFEKGKELGLISKVQAFEPFQKKWKLGVRKGSQIIIEPIYTYIEILEINSGIYFILGIGDKYGVYIWRQPKVEEVIPVEYKKIELTVEYPEIFLAYTDPKKDQFDLYYPKKLIAKDCKEYSMNGFLLKVKYIDNQQELFYVTDAYDERIIQKGKYDIQLHNGYILLAEGSRSVVYNFKGCKISEDVSGRYVSYKGMLVHIGEDGKKTFYNAEGKMIDLTKCEGVVETDEYVVIKKNGHWYLLWSI